MEYIYSRVSTDKQETENQLHELRKLYPNASIVQETTSGYKDKPQLNALIDRLQGGDVLVVAGLDRLGRHAAKALLLIEALTKQGVKVVSLREGIDTSTSSGKFVATCMFGLAEMERNLISERTKTAMAAKKATAHQTGWTCGRKKQDLKSKHAMVFEYRQQGKTIRQIRDLTGLSIGRISQLLKVA